ncbi:helix-turn-helix domain-containing protein [Dactylosporangium roseum]|uniref:Helix-turn-helix domain-containing protein n=1 Tax=Dactylosporangium roseum TaxID=47989 RepID=A0ABY5ZIE7_9ACTN|nr:helix-turn-helix domain-containing protein [Dactylosporangium roseum]
MGVRRRRRAAPARPPCAGRFPRWPRPSADANPRSSPAGWRFVIRGFVLTEAPVRRPEARDQGQRHQDRGRRLLFLPTTGPRGWVAWEEPGDVHAIVYPCTGWLADPGARRPPAALARLIGPVRAEVLTLLAAPKSTTQLVALTGHGLGSVGGHLRVLLDAGLVRRRRSGRSVLYFRTPLGEALAAPR